MRPDQRKARFYRKIAFHLTSAFLFLSLISYLASAAQELLLPIILGTFFGYLFRPMLSSVKGSPPVRFIKGCGLVAVVVGSFYGGGKLIQASLPNEKEKLELLVRLQYRLNLRYRQWMGLHEEASTKGNWAYNLVGKETDPLVDKLNQFLSLDQDQRQAFLSSRKNANPGGIENDTYYKYFLTNLAAMKQAEDLKSEEALAKDPATNPGPQVGPAEPKTGGLAHMLRLMTIWLVFPLVFTFVLMDKGQILQFFMRLVPNRYFELTRTIADEVDTALGKYIRGTMLECALVGLTIAVGLWICGFKTNVVILVAAIGGLTNAIPFVGTALALAVGSVFALIAEDIQPILPFINLDNLFLGVVAVVTIAHLLDNAIYQPLVVGGAVNIHPLVVILGVFGGSMAFGFAGLLLAIPSIVIIKVVTETLFQGLKDYKII